MPLYDYECQQCHRHTEKIQKFSDAPLTECPHCGGRLERVLHAPAVAFKGGGWYADGYGNKKSGGVGADKGGESKGESKSGDAKSSGTKSDSSAKSSEGSSSSSKDSATSTSSGSSSSASSSPAPSTPAASSTSSGSK